MASRDSLHASQRPPSLIVPDLAIPSRWTGWWTRCIRVGELSRTMVYCTPGWLASRSRQASWQASSHICRRSSVGRSGKDSNDDVSILGAVPDAVERCERYRRCQIYEKDSMKEVVCIFMIKFQNSLDFRFHKRILKLWSSVNVSFVPSHNSCLGHASCQVWRILRPFLGFSTRMTRKT